MEDNDKPGAMKPSYPFRHARYPAEKPPMTRKRSVIITLSVLGVAAAGFATLSGKDVQRNSYSTQEDCEHDYATGQCTRDASVSSGYGGGYHYYGPWYRSDWRNHVTRGDPGPGRAYASGSAATGGAGHGPTGFDFGSRGGFGSSGRVSARGG